MKGTVWNRPEQSKEWEQMGTELLGGAEPAGQAWRGRERQRGVQVPATCGGGRRDRQGTLPGSGGDQVAVGGG